MDSLMHLVFPIYDRLWAAKSAWIRAESLLSLPANLTGAGSMYKKKLNPKFWGLVAGVLAACYFYPRFLVSVLGEDNPWTSFLYMYGFGGITFALGMLVVMKAHALKPGRGNERMWFHLLIGGFVFFSTLHGLWIILSLHVPFKGAM